MHRTGLGIRAKTLLALALTLGLGVVAGIAVQHGFLLEGILRSEQQEMQQELRHVTRHAAFLLDKLSSTTADYSAWDDTARFIAGENPGYMAANITAETLTNNGLSLAALFDLRGNLVAGVTFDIPSRTFGQLPREFLDYLRANPGLFAHAHATDQVKGVVPLGPWPLLLVSRPILRNDFAGPIAGTLMFGTYLGNELLVRMGNPDDAPVHIYAAADPHLPTEVREALAALTAGEPVFLRRPSRKTMTGYTLLRDLAGAPAFTVRMDLARTIYANGMFSLQIMLVAYGLVLAVTGGLYVFLIETMVLRRVIRLGATVGRIEAGSEPAEEIVVDGTDELGVLAARVRAAFVSERLLKGEVESANRDLVRRVEARTQDLTSTIDALNREVEERRKAEERLLDLEGQQRTIIDNMVSGLVTFDENLLLTRINPAAARLLRLAPSRVGRPLLDELGADFARDVVAAFQSKEPIVRREVAVTSSEGRERVLGYVLSRIPPSGGRGAQGIVIFRDLSDERRLAAEQLRLNRLTTLGEFSAQIAHELGNPLTAMSSTVQYLAAIAGDADRDALRVLGESVERMEGLIRRLRLLSREMPLARTAIDLGELIAHLLEFLAASLRSAGIAASFRAPAVPLVITGDPAQLHQALLNLLVNAIQAMPQGGRLKVRLASGRPLPGGAPPALILIADSGSGIPPEVAGRIFEPFYTTRQAGTGLGLPIADKIVREHGGNIRFTSRPGHGACFAVILPGAAGGGKPCQKS